MELNRTTVQKTILVSALLLPLLSASAAQSATTRNYCIQGTGDGLDWDWEVRFISPTAIEIGRCAGTATAAVGASSSDIRDVLMTEINDGCGIVVTATAYSGPDCGSDPGFTADGYFNFELWLEQKVASPPGPLLQVTSTTAVQFNPICYVDVPEPSIISLLGVGVLGLFGLSRRQLRRHPAAAS